MKYASADNISHLANLNICQFIVLTAPKVQGICHQ